MLDAMNAMEELSFENMTNEQWGDFVDNLSDDKLEGIANALAPKWSGGSRVNDEPIDSDGFNLPNYDGMYDDMRSLGRTQKECWRKYNSSPHISSHVTDVQGELTGNGFHTYSDVRKIHDAIIEVEDDIRNELKLKYNKFVGRDEVEGELFLLLTAHTDGFVEVDFIDPSTLQGGDKNSGIFFHPKKTTMPLFYKVNYGDGAVIIPSIYIAHMPKLANELSKKDGFNAELTKPVQSSHSKYKSIGSYKSFIIQWDRSLFMKRNVSHIRTTIEWINHYENLKKWEIDHKKSSGAYLWVFRMTDAKAFRTWLKMSDKERRESGITAKKTPGGSIVLPPGVELDVKNPSLSSINEQDTDIMHMVTSGLNKPEDMITGQTKGDTFSGIKASRGPQADRTQDKIANFERFLRYTFWRSVFFLKGEVSDFKTEYRVREAVSFSNKTPKFKKVTKPAYDLIEFEFPISEISNLSEKAQALLGSKHPNVVEFLGISKEAVAKRLGFNAYKSHRLQAATEDEVYPDLPNAAIIESGQEDAQEISKDKDDEKKDDGKENNE